MNKAMFKFASRLALAVLCILGLIELGLGLWTVLEDRYRSLAYTLADVGYLDLWILRYLSICLFVSAIVTLVMCLILIWGLYSAHALLFIGATMIAFVVIANFVIGVITFTNKFQMRLTLQEQLPKLVITYRQGTDERASRALDILQSSFRCCGYDGRLSFQNNVPLSCNMFSVGCLTRTMFFLDSCMDALAAVLLFCSILKLFIVLFFYSFLCIYQRNHRKHRESDPHSMNNSSEWRHSSSFDSSSTENLPKKILISTPVTRQADVAHHDFAEKRRVILNDYDSQTPNKRVQGAAVLLPLSSSSSPASSASPASSKSLTTTSHDHNALRKLSSISEKTERTETDESEPDLLRIKPLNAKRQVIITAAHQKRSPPPLPTKLPIIKHRRRIARDDENDNDSGVERSSSEKSFGDQSISKPRAQTPTKLDPTTKNKPVKVKSVPTLTFSNVFVTSVSQTDTKESSPDDDIKKLLTASSSTSSSLSDHLLFTEVVTPKPILKKSPQQLSPSSDHDRIPPSYHEQKKLSSLVSNKPYVKLTQSHGNTHSSKSYVPVNRKENLTPRPAPRPSLKHSSIDKQDESLV